MLEKVSGAAVADQLVEKARELAPMIAAAAPQIERDGKVTAEVMAALHAAGMFRLALPRSLGGYELDIPSIMKIVLEIAKADASTAWCVGQGCGCSYAAAYLDPEVAREIFGPEDAVLAWGPTTRNARAYKVDGGYRVHGRWEFASGSRNAQWLGGHCFIYNDDDSPVLEENGKHFDRTVVIPKGQANIDDVWQVMGLKGTGSDNYQLDGLVVPEKYSFTRDHAPDRREPGTLYRFSVINFYSAAFSAVALGVSRALLDDFKKLATRKKPSATGQLLSENAAIQQQVGYNEAHWMACYAYLMRTFEEMWEDVERTGECNPQQRITLRTVSAYVIQNAQKIGDFAYHAAGASAIFADGPFEQRFRDLNCVSQQVQGHMQNFENAGRMFMGMEAAPRR